MTVLLIILGLIIGGIVGFVIAHLAVTRKIRKQTTWGIIRLIGVNDETTQFEAGVQWPEVEDIANHKYVVLEVVNTQKKQSL